MQDGEMPFGMHKGSYGPTWDYLSESVQAQMIEYLFSLGIKPEIGLCVEYLSWNKEQRLYMQWLRDIYFVLFQDGEQFPSPQRIKSQTDSYQSLIKNI